MPNDTYVRVNCITPFFVEISLKTINVVKRNRNTFKLLNTNNIIHIVNILLLAVHLKETEKGIRVKITRRAKKK